MNFSSAIVLLILASVGSCSAFLVDTKFSPVTSSNPSVLLTRELQRQHQLFINPQCRSKLYASAKGKGVEDDEEDEPLSDELSKLIGKRASISSKKTPSSTSRPIPSDNDEDAIIDPSFEKMYEGKSGMDIFEMPDFKAKRPLKTPKETEDKARGGEGKESTQSEGYIDFMADYDDENDLHIPNRMGISTIAWGDVDQGFKAGKKLKKKEIKAGYFLAGDLQVSSYRV